MPSWQLPFNTVRHYGRPYLLESDPLHAPGAFAVRIAHRVEGAIEHTQGGYVVAFGNACTHMGCLLVKGEENDQGRLSYQPPHGHLPEQLSCGPCPCHGTSFDLTRQGLVILGPATQHLPQLRLGISSDGQSLIATAWRQAGGDPRTETWPWA